MNRRLTVIGAVMKKDLTVLWPIVVINIALIALVFVNGAEAFAASPDRVRMLLGFLPIAAVFSSLVVCFGVAHQDPVPGSAQDWPTRPIARLDLVLAKLAFLCLAIIAPLAISASVASLYGGRTLVEAAVNIGMAWTFVLLTPIVLAVAALTRNLLEAIAVSFCLVILVVAATLFYSRLVPASDQMARAGFMWIGGFAGNILSVVLAVGFLYLLYGVRKVALARLLAIPALLLTLAVTFAIPWDTAVAIQRAVTGNQPEKPMRLASPQCVTVGEETNRVERGASSYASDRPFRTATPRIPIEGVPADWTVYVEKIEVEGKTAPFIDVRSIARPVPDARLAISPTVVLESGEAPKPLALKAIISLMEPVRVSKVALTDDRRYIEGVGWCSVKTANRRRTLECNLWPGAQTARLFIGDTPIDCRVCGTQEYGSALGEMSHRTWLLPANAPAEATLKTFRYHSTSTLRTTVEPATWLDPARACPVPAMLKPIA